MLRFIVVGLIVNAMSKSGMVSFVGIGPGDPNQLTLRAAEVIRLADTVVHDTKVGPEILAHARKDAERILVGAEYGPGSEQLSQLLAAKAKDGKRVVRLTSGDPYFDIQVTAEADRVAQTGVRFEVVPGLPFVLAALARLGIPLFHPQSKAGLSILAAIDSETNESIDWAWLCKAKGTRIVLGNFGNLAELIDRLSANGLGPDAPVVLVQADTKGKPRSVVGPLCDLKPLVASAGLQKADAVIVGDVISLRPRLNWADKLPLAGQRIAVTRAREQAGDLTRLLLERGAEVLEVPCIRIEPPTKQEPLEEALAGLGCYDWIIFTSVNGVTAFFEHFFRMFEDLRDLGGVRIAAVGPATAARLQALHLKVDCIPKDHTAAAIANDLAEMGSLENLRILLPRAEVATPDLPALLEDKGAIVDDIPCYRTVAETEDLTGAAAQLREQGADWITFTSGSTVEQCHSRFNLLELKRKFPALRLASIGPETTKALAALSLKADFEARPHTIEALVAGVEKMVKQSRRKPAE